MSASSKTLNHDEIRKWVEERGGRPSMVRTGKGKGKGKSGGVLRIDFGPKDDKLDEVSWEEFFQVFDQSQISFLHQDETKDGKESRFNKFVESTGDEQPAKKKGEKAGTAKKAAPDKGREKADKKGTGKAKAAEKSPAKAAKPAKSAKPAKKDGGKPKAGKKAKG